MADEDGKPTVVERPASSPDNTPTSAERPRALGTLTPPEPMAAVPRRSSRRDIPAQRYESGNEIGRGGMGRVVEATDTLLDRRVAVKEALTTDAELLRRFARETKITAKLEHPSIVPVYDAGVVDGQPFYVMRRVTGRPLSELIRNAPTLSERLALVPNLLAAAQAIAHAHQRGIIHRDIKPSNILVGELGETVVIDWGLAKVIGEPDDDEAATKEPDASSSLRTRIGAVFGTPGFMAPDQLAGEPVGPQSDVYALGASLYNLLAAEPPHYTSDSTQMMKLASQGPPMPIGDLVPGVPAELSTIVDTALDYDTARRYRDAGAFAEELKRFLAGQLVASHRYSAVEKLVRFVRQHRAAVAIGTAATVLMIVVGAIAVSRVVEERDRANEQTHLATQRQREAETARATADERSDQMLIARARSLVDVNPTAAISSLKQLPATSKHIDEARAIVSAARQHGAAWAMRGSDIAIAYATLDHQGRRLAVATVDGTVIVFDLDLRKKLYERQTGRGPLLRWVLESKYLMIGGRGPTLFLDPATGMEVESGLPPITDIALDDRARTMLATDSGGQAVLIDVESRTVTPLGIRDVREIVISPDGMRLGVVTKTSATVLDRAGKPLITYPHNASVVRLVVSNTKAALLDDVRVFRAQLQPNAKWEEQITEMRYGHRPLALDFLGEKLFVTWTDTRVVVEYSKNEMREVGRMNFTSGLTERFGSNYMMVGSDGRRIHYIDGTRLSAFYLPIALRHVRAVGRPNVQRLVACGDGGIVVLELDLMPRAITVDHYLATVFARNDMLVSANSFAYDFTWYDLAKNKSTRFFIDHIGTYGGLDRDDGRLVIFELTGHGRRAVVFRAGETDPLETVEEKFDVLEILEGGGLARSDGNRVYAGLREPRPQVFSTDGAVKLMNRAGNNQFVAISDNEVARYDLEKKTLARSAFPDGPPIIAATEHGGEIYLARGAQILRWVRNETFVEVARFAARIEEINGTEAGLVVVLADGASLFVLADGTARRLASTRGTVVLGKSRLIVPGQFNYDIVELPSFARWSLMISRTRDTTTMQIDMSPDGSQILEKGLDGRLWLWPMPTHDEDMATLLGRTNFVEDKNGVLLWPWQAPQ